MLGSCSMVSTVLCASVPSFTEKDTGHVEVVNFKRPDEVKSCQASVAVTAFGSGDVRSLHWASFAFASQMDRERTDRPQSQHFIQKPFV